MQSNTPQLDKEIEKGTFHFSIHQDDECFDTMIVQSSTDKAIKVMIDDIRKPFWLPKKALKCKNEIYSLKSWFKNYLEEKQNTYILIALGIN